MRRRRRRRRHALMGGSCTPAITSSPPLVEVLMVWRIWPKINRLEHIGTCRSIDRSIDRESRVSCHVQEGECNIGEKGETGRASFRGGEPTGRVYFMYIYKCINITLYSTCRMIRIDECAGMQRIYIRYRRLRYIERNGRMTMTTMMMMDLWVVVVML